MWIVDCGSNLIYDSVANSNWMFDISRNISLLSPSNKRLRVSRRYQHLAPHDTRNVYEIFAKYLPANWQTFQFLVTDVVLSRKSHFAFANENGQLASAYLKTREGKNIENQFFKSPTS
jgi:hypothetical protein